MVIDLKEYVDLIDNEVICKKILKGDFFEHNPDFVDSFLSAARHFNWSWAHRDINRENVISSVVEYMYQIVKGEVVYFKLHNKWKEEDFVSRSAGSGRINVVCGDFELTEDHAWLDLDLMVSL